MKDYYNIWLLSQQFDFDGELLRNAIHTTFKLRRTALPKEVPVGLTPEFVSDGGKLSQWQAFIRRSRLVATNLSLETV